MVATTDPSPNGSQPTPILEVRAARKAYGAVVALDGVNLQLYPREVLALLGDNGAGKSTLVKAISGAVPLDGGTVLIGGREARIRHPADARKAGIETVYQDLALFDNLSATANFYVGREITRPTRLGPLGFLRGRAMAAETEEIVKRLRVNVPDLASDIGLMSGGQRQAIAVARAVAFATKVVILDEPTAALGVRESREVLDLIRDLPSHGVSVILISHNIEQVTEVADRALVLRRGRNVGEERATAENHERIVSLIVGSTGSKAHQRQAIDESTTTAGSIPQPNGRQ